MIYLTSQRQLIEPRFKQMRLMASIQQLLKGAPITSVALESGYESHSAYTVAFKKNFGCPPSEFVLLSKGGSFGERA